MVCLQTWVGWAVSWNFNKLEYEAFWQSWHSTVQCTVLHKHYSSSLTHHSHAMYVQEWFVTVYTILSPPLSPVFCQFPTFNSVIEICINSPLWKHHSVSALTPSDIKHFSHNFIKKIFSSHLDRCSSGVSTHFWGYVFNTLSIVPLTRCVPSRWCIKLTWCLSSLKCN